MQRSSATADGKRVFLTGASSGIGLATARALIECGCQVWGTSRQIARLPTGLENFHPIALDLTDEGSILTGFSKAQSEAGGRFDVLINNAGGGWFGPALQMPTSDLREQFQTLVFGPLALIQLALPAMRAASPPRGLVINITSLAAKLPLPYAAAYSAAKAALSSFSATLRMEEADVTAAGAIRFVDVQPGDSCTDFNRALHMPDALRDPAAVVADPAIAAAQRTLHVSNHDVDTGPSPDFIAQHLCRIVQAANPPVVLACGTFYQATLGSLAVRFLPARWLERSIRQHFASR